MLKLSLVVMFLLSLATLSFASSLMPMPGARQAEAIETADAMAGPDAASLDPGQPRPWFHTFE